MKTNQAPLSAFNENQAIIDEALSLLTDRLKNEGIILNSPDVTKNYCRLKLATKEHEVFGALFLDNQHRLIEYQELFRGTINSCHVHIREVAKEALRLNCAAVIFTHNHPSGICEPSLADVDITKIEGVRVIDILCDSVYTPNT